MTASEQSSAAVPESELTATAYHEAGHAVMAVLLGRQVHKVSIAPGQMGLGVRLGACEIRKGTGKGSKDWIEEEVLILLAGMVGQAQWVGEYCRTGATQDLLGVRRLLSQSRAVTERQLERLEQRMLDKAEYLLGDAAAAQAVAWVAAELLQKTTISGRAVRHWWEQAQRSS